MVRLLEGSGFSSTYTKRFIYGRPFVMTYENCVVYITNRHALGGDSSSRACTLCTYKRALPNEHIRVDTWLGPSFWSSGS